MTSDEQKIETLRMIAENFGVVLSERAIFMWLGLLEDYTLPEIQKAAMNLIRHAGNNEVAYKTMPPFALMQKELDAVTGRFVTQSLDARAESAWEKLIDSVETFGSYQIPKELDKTSLYCIHSLGGWRAVCNWRESEMNWRKKDFIDLYKLADGKTELLEAGPQAIEAYTRGTLEISATDTKKAVADFMDTLKDHNFPQGLPQ